MSHSYDRWIQRPKAESIDCAACPMTHARRSKNTRDPGPFLKDLKCCTYFPFLPNFTLGGLLKSKHPLVEDAIAKGRISPLGLFESQAHSDLAASLGFEAFGRAKSLACPFLENAKCTIWNERPSVCSSYYCESSRGHDYWQKEDERLRTFEMTLAHLALWKLGFTPEDSKSEKWFEYEDRKRELLIKTHELSLEISPEEVQELLGDHAHV